MNSIEANETTVAAPGGHDNPDSSITIVAQQQTNPSTQPELDLHLIHTGYDRVCASGRAHSHLRPPVQPPEIISLPDVSGHLVLIGRWRRQPKRRLRWRQTVKYVHQPTGHHVRLFYDRSTRFVPEVYVILRPADGHVFSLSTLLLLLNAIGRTLNLSLTLSRLEIAADFAAIPMDAHHLASHLWVPRIPAHRCIGNEFSSTVYRGAPSSAFQLKTYRKHEGTLHALRIEYTFHGRALRRLHVDRPGSLAEVSWGEACSRRAGLITIKTDQRRRTSLSTAAREAFLSGGVFAVLDRLGKPGMRWLSRNMLPAPTQRTLENALSALALLPSASPQENAQSELIDPEIISALLRSVDIASTDLPTALPSELRLLTEDEDLLVDIMGSADTSVIGVPD